MTVINPTSLDDALAALAQRPNALVVAGGTDAMVEINSGGHEPADVVSVARVTELRSWSHDPQDRTVSIGAAVTYSELMMPPLCDLVPALAQASRTVGSPQIRNTATLGGNLATCSPAGDGLPVLAALDAVVHVRSPDAERTVAVGDFMVGVKRTALRPGELIIRVTLPVLDGWQGYAKVGVRNAMVIAIASVCVGVDQGSQSVRIALGSVAPTIVRCPEAEAMAAMDCEFASRRATADVVRRVADAAASASRPIDDHRSTAAYRRHAVGVLTGRLLRRAFPNE